MTRGIIPAVQKAQDSADFWRGKYTEEQQLRLQNEEDNKNAVAEAQEKGKAEGRREAFKEQQIWKEGFEAGQRSAVVAAAEVPPNQSILKPEQPALKVHHHGGLNGMGPLGKSSTMPAHRSRKRHGAQSTSQAPEDRDNSGGLFPGRASGRGQRVRFADLPHHREGYDRSAALCGLASSRSTASSALHRGTQTSHSQSRGRVSSTSSAYSRDEHQSSANYRGRGGGYVAHETAHPLHSQ